MVRRTGASWLIAQSSNRCGTSQCNVIIQALAPVMGPYISRVIAIIHIQENIGSMTSSTTADLRSHRNAHSRSVGGRWAGGITDGMGDQY
jgi:hypothetical protein